MGVEKKTGEFNSSGEHLRLADELEIGRKGKSRVSSRQIQDGGGLA